jgi:YfiH family protein
MTADRIILPEWPAPRAVRAFVTTRALPGNSLPPYDAFNLGLRSGESEATVQANRDLLVRAFALPSPPCWLRQVHGVNVVAIGGPHPASGHLPPQAGEGKAGDAVHDGNVVAIGGPNSASGHLPPQAGEGAGRNAEANTAVATATVAAIEPEGDAAVTRERGVVLAILTADCLPILLCADDGSEVGAVHAGWRGLSAGVIEACVARMRAPPQRLLAWLGPAIGARSYEVGGEVRAAFLAHDAGAGDAFVSTRPGHWLCDLYTLARRRLAAAGVERIFGGGFDTLTDERFYSYRRDGERSGRFASLIHIT